MQKLSRIVSVAVLASGISVVGTALGYAQNLDDPKSPKPYSPQAASDQSEAEDWDDQEIVHPASQNTQDSQSTQNAQNFGDQALADQPPQPDIVPFEGELNETLNAGSREILEDPGMTVFVPRGLDGESRVSASGGRMVGSIIQLPDGQLQFRLRPEVAERALSAASRPAGDVEEELDSTEPELVGGTYRTPLGYGARDEDRELDDEPVQVGGAHRSPPGAIDSSIDFQPARESEPSEESHSDYQDDYQDELSGSARELGDDNEAAVRRVLADSSRQLGRPPVEWAAPSQGIYRFRAYWNGESKPLKFRFIRMEYNAPYDANRIRNAFKYVARRLEQLNITHPTGGDGNFFTDRGLNNARFVVLGFAEYNTGQYGYVVLHHISPQQVRYVRDSGRSGRAVRDPDNFVTWDVFNCQVQIQLWKHGRNDFDAAAAFRLKSKR